MKKEVFLRREIKYIITRDVFESIRNVISPNMEYDVYSKDGIFYKISNIYYDTHDNHFIRTSVSKPVYREKLRLRTYGTPDSEQGAYVEIKKKFNGITNKRRSAMILSEAYEFLQTGIAPEIKPYMNIQVLNEIRYMLQCHKLVPRVCITYERLAYYCPDQPDLRISFDKNIRARRDDLKLEAKTAGKHLLDEDNIIMEVKAINPLPLWFINALKQHKLYSRRFSKTRVEYMNFLKGQSEQEED